MKHLISSVFFILTTLNVWAQPCTVADACFGNGSRDASAQVTINASNQGFLVPRLTLTERNSIIAPATGLLIYQTNNTPGFYYYTGSAWALMLNNTGTANTVAYYNSSGNLTSSGSLSYTGTVFKARTTQGYELISSSSGTPFAGAYVADSANNVLLTNGVTVIGDKTARLAAFNYVTNQESEVSANYFASTGNQGVLIKSDGITGSNMTGFSSFPNDNRFWAKDNDNDSILLRGTSWDGAAQVEQFRFTQNGELGIGTATPGGGLDVDKTYANGVERSASRLSITVANSTNNNGVYTAATFEAEKTDNNSEAAGVLLGLTSNALISGNGTLQDLIGVSSSVEYAGSGTQTKAFSYLSDAVISGAGAITDYYAYKVGVSAGTNQYGFYNDAAGSINQFTQTRFTEDIQFTTKTINTTAGDAATINSPAGRFRKDVTGASFTLTNSYITANSIIVLTPANAAIDATALSYTVSAGAGSATITLDAAPTANFDMNFLVIN